MSSEVAAPTESWRERALILAAAAAALLIWGATPMITRVAVMAIDPTAVGILRTVLAGIVAVPLALALRLPRPGNGREWGLLLVAALGGFVGFPVLFTIGVRHTSASHAALIIAASPLFTGLIAAAVERRQPRAAWRTGAALAFAGEAALIGFPAGFGGPDVTLAGDLLVLTGGVGAAAGYVAGARLSERLNAWATTFWGIGLGGLLLLPVATGTIGPAAWAGAGALGWAAVAYLALFSTILAYVCWYWALRRGGIARIGATQFAQPVIALAFAVMILGEPLTPLLAVSAAIIVVGVAIAQRH